MGAVDSGPYVEFGALVRQDRLEAGPHHINGLLPVNVDLLVLVLEDLRVCVCGSRCVDSCDRDDGIAATAPPPSRGAQTPDGASTPSTRRARRVDSLTAIDATRVDS